MKKNTEKLLLGKIIKFLPVLITLQLVMLFSVNCNTQKKKIIRQPTPSNRIEFGYIDKSTRGMVTYILDDQGILYQKDVISQDHYIELEISQEEAAYIHKMANRLQTSRSTLYEIGEKTHFIRVVKGIEITEWKWNVNDHSLSEEIKKLDIIFMRIFDKN